MNAGAAPEILRDSQGSLEIHRRSQGSTNGHLVGLVSFHEPKRAIIETCTATTLWEGEDRPECWCRWSKLLPTRWQLGELR